MNYAASSLFSRNENRRWRVCLRVNNHSLPARFREKMQNLAALHRSRGWLFIETAVASPVPDSSPVTFAENFHLVIVLA